MSYQFCRIELQVSHTKTFFQGRNRFFCRDENLNEFFAVGREIFLTSLTGFHLTLQFKLDSHFDGNKHGLVKFYSILSFPEGLSAAAFALQNNINCMYPPWESLHCIESGQDIKIHEYFTVYQEPSLSCSSVQIFC